MHRPLQGPLTWLTRLSSFRYRLRLPARASFVEGQHERWSGPFGYIGSAWPPRLLTFPFHQHQTDRTTMFDMQDHWTRWSSGWPGFLAMSKLPHRGAGSGTLSSPSTTRVPWSHVVAPSCHCSGLAIFHTGHLSVLVAFSVGCPTVDCARPAYEPEPLKCSPILDLARAPSPSSSRPCLTGHV